MFSKSIIRRFDPAAEITAGFPEEVSLKQGVKDKQEFTK